MNPTLSLAEPAVRLVTARMSLLTCLRELVAYRGLLWIFTVREVKVRYNQTLLGAAWAIAQPLSLTAAFALFFGSFARVPSDGAPYPLFYYAALLPWTFFTTCLAFGVPSLVTNTLLLTRVYFPREILPIAAVFSAGVDLAAASLVYGLLMLYYGLAPTSAWAFLFPVLVIQVLFVVGVTLILSAVNVSYRDVRYALPLVTQIWLYATPVIYPLSVVPAHLRDLYLTINPMAAITEAYRHILIAGQAPSLRMMGAPALSALVLTIAGYVYFKRAERHFADVI